VGVIRVVLVDDQELVRTGFRLVLGGQPDLEVVGEAGDGAEAIEVVGQTRPDVVVMDVRVLILTTFDLDEYVYEAIRAGASGFLLKDTGARNLIDAIRIVHSGEAVVAPSTTRRLFDRFATLADSRRPDRREVPGVPLTAREVEVLREVALGLSNAEIADKMFLSEATVRTHVSHILGKLGLRDRVQAVVYAYEMRLVRAGA
jgi:DNA-binding NarL/FixJ family response regulator